MKIATLQGTRSLLRLSVIVVHIFRKFTKDNCHGAAAALTYITLLSLVPLVAISLSVLSGFKTSQEAFLNFVFQYLVPTPSLQEIIVTNIKNFAQQTTTLSIFGGLFLILASVFLLNTIEGTFNHIWGATHRRPLVIKFASFWSVITLSPILIAVALILSLKLTEAPFVGSIVKMAVVKGFHHYFLPFFLTFLAIFIMYRVLPHARVKIKPAIIGSIIATFLFLVARWGFEVYVAAFAHFDKIYGMLGTLPIFFVWIYICWVVILFGGEVTYTVQHVKLEIKGEEFIQGHYDGYYGLRVMMTIGRSFQKGDRIASLEELAESLEIPYGYLVGILNRLREKGIIHSVEEGKEVYLPARSLERITVQDVIEAVRGDPFHVPSSAHGGDDDQALGFLFQKAQKGVERSLRGITIEALLKKVRATGASTIPSAASSPPKG